MLAEAMQVLHNREGRQQEQEACMAVRKQTEQEVTPSCAILKTHPSDVLPPERFSVIL